MADQRKKKASKFDDSDGNDDQHDKGARDPYSKPSRGGGKQVNQEKKAKQPKMNLDNDDDFPAL